VRSDPRRSRSGNSPHCQALIALVRLIVADLNLGNFCCISIKRIPESRKGDGAGRRPKSTPRRGFPL
jgi:hypothetical protein